MMDYMDDSNSRYITIFGVTKENSIYVKELFSDYHPIYLSSNYYDVEGWESSLKWESIKVESNESAPQNQTKVESFQGKFHEKEKFPAHFFDNIEANEIQDAVSSSIGNWIYARLSLQDFDEIQKKQSMFVLKNKDVIYCMNGIYQSEEGYSDFQTKEDKLKIQMEKTEPNIYKMPKMKNLSNLTFEGKTFSIKFNEFIVGNYMINSEDEVRKDDNLGSMEYILIVALIIFFIIFIYKLSK